MRGGGVEFIWMKCTKNVQSRVLSERDVNKFNGPSVYLQLGKVELLKYFNTTINHQPSTINHQPSTINHQQSTINIICFYSYHPNLFPLAGVM